MKILIFGSSGILGYKLYIKLKSNYKVYHNGLIKRKLNLNYKNLEILLKRICPDVIINCAALTNIDECEKNKIKCKKINFDLINNLFLIKKKNNLNFKLLHFSTDQMYDSKHNSSREISRIFIKNYYTKTKIMSERICLNNHALVFRINFFGVSNKGRTFSDWVRKKFMSNKRFYLVDDVYFNPISLTTISEIVDKIIKKKLFFSGIYNLGSKDKISKKDFAIKYAKLCNIYKKNYEIKKINELVETKRPKNMYMNTKKFLNRFKIKLPYLVNEIKKEISYKK